jgi:hypothetical protein
MTCQIDVKNDTLFVNNFETANKEIVSYFSGIPEPERVAKFESMLLAGTVAFKSIGTTEKIDYIEKCFNSFHQCFDDKIDETFGQDGKIIKEVFDPNREGTPLYYLKNEITQLMKDIKRELEGKKKEEEILDKTTYKGYDFENFCENVLSDIIHNQTDGDELERTTDKPGNIKMSKKGDFVIRLGKIKSNIVLETKYVGTITIPEIQRTLKESMENRDAKYGIFVIKKVESLPKSVGFFKEFNDNQLVIALGTGDGEDLIAKELLLVAFSWAKAKLIGSEVIPGEKDIIPMVREKINKIQQSLDKFRNIKVQCTNLQTATESIRTLTNNIKDDIGKEIQEMETEIKKIVSES